MSLCTWGMGWEYIDSDLIGEIVNIDVDAGEIEIEISDNQINIEVEVTNV